jgi:hypothetical protein
MRAIKFYDIRAITADLPSCYAIFKMAAKNKLSRPAQEKPENYKMVSGK